MNEIHIDTSTLPVVGCAASRVGTKPFKHPDRITPFHILIYVLEGEITVTEADIDYTIKSGELLFLKSGIHHYGKQTILPGTSWYFVHFYLSTPSALIPTFVPTFHEGNTNQTTNDSLCTTVLPKKLTSLPDSPIVDKLKQLIDYYNEPTPLRNLWINHHFYEILMLCAASSFSSSLKEDTLTDQIASYIREHLTTPCKAEALEDQFFLSYKHMEALFKKEKGITIGQYHTKLRIRMACELLSTTTLSVSQIGERLGYKDPLYFSRSFKKQVGVSPRDYRINPPFTTL